MEKVLSMQGITKRFPGVLANDHINFEAYRGEIVSLLGENGAGKTTLMKILYGMYSKDEGEIYIKGKKVEINSPKDAIDNGIGMVHQHFTLVNPFSVTENIILGLPGDKVTIDLDEAKNKIKEYMDRYGLHVDPDAKIWQISVGEKQRVEILKVLFRNAEIIILDEPTAVLTPQEVDELFKTLRILRKEGKTIIFISHKLYEVLEISDRIVVLRSGKVVGETTPDKTSIRELAKMMVGKEVIEITSKEPPKLGEEVFKVENLSVMSDRGYLALKNISFMVRSGEILGVAGVAGNGQKELEDVISGVRKPVNGKVILLNKEITGKSPKEIIEMGVGRIPEDRMDAGLILDIPLYENLVVEYFDKPPFSKGPFLNYKEIKSYAEKLVKEFDIRTPNVNVITRTLSGGNLQKVILARVISREPKFLIASQPTRGLDVGAAEYIHERLLQERANGCAILLISEDLDEIMNLSDRIMVLYEGEIMGFVNRGELPKEEIGLMMTGTRKEALSEIS